MVRVDVQTRTFEFDGSAVVLHGLPLIVSDQSLWPFEDLSWTLTVPLEMLPHSAPFPLTPSVPVPVASSEPQFDPHDLAMPVNAAEADCGATSAATPIAHTARTANRLMASLSAEVAEMLQRSGVSLL